MRRAAPARSNSKARAGVRTRRTATTVRPSTRC